METLDLVRAWRDEDYRLTQELGGMSTHPAGSVETEVYVAQNAQSGTCEGYSSCFHFCSY